MIDNKNKKLYEETKSSIVSGETIPYYFAPTPVVKEGDKKKIADKSVLGYPLLKDSVLYTEGRERLVHEGDLLYLKNGEIKVLDKRNAFLYSEIPFDYKKMYDKTIEEFEIREKTSDELLIEAIKNQKFLAAPVSKNEAGLYKDALNQVNISCAYTNGHIVVRKNDGIEATAAISALRTMSDREKDEFVKDKSTFENKFEAELKKIEERDKTVQVIVRDEEAGMYLPQKLKQKKVKNKEIISPEDVSVDELKSSIKDGKVADIGTANDVHEEKIERVAESTNDETVLDEKFSPGDPNKDTMSSDYPDKSERDDEDDPYGARTLFY